MEDNDGNLRVFFDNDDDNDVNDDNDVDNDDNNDDDNLWEHVDHDDDNKDDNNELMTKSNQHHNIWRRLLTTSL